MVPADSDGGDIPFKRAKYYGASGRAADSPIAKVESRKEDRGGEEACEPEYHGRGFCS